MIKINKRSNLPELNYQQLIPISIKRHAIFPKYVMRQGDIPHCLTGSKIRRGAT
jgi:hypothetical protein